MGGGEWCSGHKLRAEMAGLPAFEGAARPDVRACKACVHACCHRARTSLRTCHLVPCLQVFAAFPEHVKEQGLTLEGLQRLYEQVAAQPLLRLLLLWAVA